MATPIRKAGSGQFNGSIADNKPAPTPQFTTPCTVARCDESEVGIGAKLVPCTDGDWDSSLGRCTNCPGWGRESDYAYI